jgi:hypothetical protein
MTTKTPTKLQTKSSVHTGVAGKSVSPSVQSVEVTEKSGQTRVPASQVNTAQQTERDRRGRPEQPAGQHATGSFTGTQQQPPLPDGDQTPASATSKKQ